MRTYTSIILMSLVINGVLAQTSIKDKSPVFGTWVKEKSPYIIEREAIIPIGKVLTIEPGVRVEFKTGIEDDYSESGAAGSFFEFDIGFLRIEGSLVANGTEKDQIIFTNHDNKGDGWGILYFSNSNNNLLNYCIIENSNRVVNVSNKVEEARAGVTLYKSSISVKNTVIRNGIFGIELQSSKLELENSRIEQMKNIAINAVFSEAHINNCTILNNERTLGLAGEVNININKCLLLRNYVDFDTRLIDFIGALNITNSALEISELPDFVSDQTDNTYNIGMNYSSENVGANLKN